MINSKILGEVLIKISKSKNGEKSIEAFFDYLKKKNFVGFLPQIKKYIIKKNKESLETNSLIIYTKYEISDKDIKNIISLVGADQDTKVEIIKDEKIIGGFSATYRGNIYDGSLRNQITQLEAKLNS